MLNWFEKHSKISWFVTIVIASTIFYVSSLTFKPETGGAIGVRAIFYHFLIFFLLSFFLSISLIKGANKNIFFIILSMPLAIIYGISDEIHQYFVPGRFASIKDIILDTFGILSASFLYIISLYYRNGR